MSSRAWRAFAWSLAEGSTLLEERAGLPTMVANYRAEILGEGRREAYFVDCR